MTFRPPTAPVQDSEKPPPMQIGGGFCSVELRGLEPLTPTLPVWCATSCAIAPYPFFGTGGNPVR